ncbi:MAG: PD-(D/E)XK nuclease domain-containing protein, partial [Candidatus Riflebacteria bacterium]|nr:PD-(D/E)XK nuclease domain-containing protein [Candidatus Riflebacteria bacterium]
MFSPWDLICFAQKIRNDADAKAESFWTETSSNEIIRTLLEKASEKNLIDEVSNELETLVSGGTITKNIVQAITYKDLYDSIENIWSVMLSTGYLTLNGYDKDGNIILSIPNNEIKNVYVEKIQQWVKASWKNVSKSINKLAQAFLSGDSDKAQSILNSFTSKAISLRDSMRQKDSKESFYHGLILGMLSNEWREGYTVKSNREAGKGYLDICILSDDMKVGAILEIKLAKNDNDYDNACNKALKQIDKRNYTKIFRPIITKTVYKYGIACRQKLCQIRKSEN